MTEPAAIAALARVADALDALGVSWHIGGSLASSAFGIGRSTLDVDLVVDLRAEHIEPLCARLRGDFYAEPALLRNALTHRSCANVIHLQSMHKVDLFVVKDTPYDRQVLGRSVHKTVPGSTRTFPFATAEDIVLNKLRWFQQGGEMSERQWTDVLGVLRVQASALDDAYLDHWADRLGLERLLSRARTEL